MILVFALAFAVSAIVLAALTLTYGSVVLVAAALGAVIATVATYFRLLWGGAYHS